MVKEEEDEEGWGGGCRCFCKKGKVDGFEKQGMQSRRKGWMRDATESGAKSELRKSLDRSGVAAATAEERFVEERWQPE